RSSPCNFSWFILRYGPFRARYPARKAVVSGRPTQPPFPALRTKEGSLSPPLRSYPRAVHSPGTGRPPVSFNIWLIRRQGYINGNQVYLKLLQEAYRRHVQELRLKKQDAEAERYLRRLYILDRGAFLDKAVAGGNLQPPASPAAGANKPAAPEPAKPAATVRLKSDDEDPFQISHTLTKPDNRASLLLARAEEEFGNQHF